jgi:hypothetical protein
MDAIDAAAGVVRRYRIHHALWGARTRLYLALGDAGEGGRRGAREEVGRARRSVEINRLENAADTVHDEALRRLFEHERTPSRSPVQEMLDLLGWRPMPARTSQRARASSSTRVAVMEHSLVIVVVVAALVFDYIASTTPPTPSPPSSRRGCSSPAGGGLGGVLLRRHHLRHRVLRPWAPA